MTQSTWLHVSRAGCCFVFSLGNFTKQTYSSARKDWLVKSESSAYSSHRVYTLYRYMSTWVHEYERPRDQETKRVRKQENHWRRKESTLASRKSTPVHQLSCLVTRGHTLDRFICECVLSLSILCGWNSLFLSPLFPRFTFSPMVKVRLLWHWICFTLFGHQCDHFFLLFWEHIWSTWPNLTWNFYSSSLSVQEISFYSQERVNKSKVKLWPLI